MASVMKRAVIGRAVVMQHLRQPRGSDIQLVHEQRTHLRIAVLLHDEHLVVGWR